MTGTVVATANVAASLDLRDAAASLRLVLEHEPDLVGLQEWYPVRRFLLRRTAPEYLWRAPLLGGCAVGVRRGRFEPLHAGSVVLSGPGLADRGTHWPNLEPARVATEVRCRDVATGARVCLLDFHLVYGVQAADGYRADRPRLVERHRAEVDRLVRRVAAARARAETVYAVGDSNFHGLSLPGLTSVWQGRPGTGTLGPARQVDDVFGPTLAHRVSLVETQSDHRAVVAHFD